MPPVFKSSFKFRTLTPLEREAQQQESYFFKNTSRHNFGIAIIFFSHQQVAVNIIMFMVVQKSHLHIHSGLKIEK